MSGIELFLNTELHPISYKGYVHQSEFIHYVFFKILYDKKCKEFFREVLGSEIDFEHSEFVYQPNRGAFDFLIKIGEISYFWEIKVWTKLSTDQFERQKKFLIANNGTGVYVLFAMGGWDWLSDEGGPTKKIDNNIIMVGESAVKKAIKMIKLDNYDNDTNDIIKSYYKIMDKLE